jgi:hypothetical protein
MVAGSMSKFKRMEKISMGEPGKESLIWKKR